MKFAKFYDYLQVSAPSGLRIPEDAKEKAKFIDNFVERRKHLVVTVRATHAARLTRNHGFYLPDKMRTGAKSMLSRERGGTEPYDKPILVNHDRLRDAVGRIISADYVDMTQQVMTTDATRPLLNDLSRTPHVYRAVDIVESLMKTGLLFDETWKGLGYIKSGGLITDPDAIVKILDGRYITVSTGASSDHAICSVCHEDWVSEGSPCEHRPGKSYDDKHCFLIAGKLYYDEWSWVNSPADTEAIKIGAQLVDIPTNTGSYQPVSVDSADLRDMVICDFYTTHEGTTVHTNTTESNTDATEADPVTESETVVVSDESTEAAVAADATTGEETTLVTESKVEDTAVAAVTEDAQESVKVLEPTVEELKTKLAGVQEQSDNLVEQLKWLRVELQDMYAEKKGLEKQLEDSTVVKHQLLAENTALMKLQAAESTVTYADLLDLQKQKTFTELHLECDHLQNTIDFDKLIVRSGNKSESVTSTLEDPTLADGTKHKSDSSDKIVPDKWTSQVISRYKQLLDKEGMSTAQKYLVSAQSHGLVSRNFRIQDFLDQDIN